MVPTVCVLSFNSRDTIERTIESARRVSPEVIVIDSGSTDGTVELAAATGAIVLHHPFENYGLQRNWGHPRGASQLRLATAPGCR